MHAEESRPGTLYKKPQCGCCEEYARYLEDHGFKVAIKPTDDLSTIKRMAGVPERLEACHQRHFATWHALGLARHAGRKAEPFAIYEVSDGPTKVYAVE